MEKYNKAMEKYNKNVFSMYHRGHIGALGFLIMLGVQDTYVHEPQNKTKTRFIKTRKLPGRVSCACRETGGAALAQLSYTPSLQTA